MNDPIPDMEDHMPGECYDVALGTICELCCGEPAYRTLCPYWQQWEAADRVDCERSFAAADEMFIEHSRGMDGWLPRQKTDREILAYFREGVDALSDDEVAAGINAILAREIPYPERLVPKGEKPTPEQIAPLIAAFRAAHPMEVLP